MNKNFHKVIFNKIQQHFVVVSELAKNERKSPALPKAKAEDFFAFTFSQMFAKNSQDLTACIGTRAPAGGSAGSQYLTTGDISFTETAKDMGEAWITKDFGFKKFLAWNVGTGFAEGYLSGSSVEDGVSKAISKSLSTSAGYAVGKKIETSLNSRLNPFSESLKTEPIYSGSFISKYKEPNSLPTGVGNVLDSSTGKYLEYKQDEKEMYKGVGK